MNTSKNIEKNAIFSIISWTIALSLTVIGHEYIVRYLSWNAEQLSLTDEIFTIARLGITAGLLTSISNFIFSELHFYDLIGNSIVRRFLPIIQFLIITTIWVVAVFYMLESLNINTRGILTGAGIWWALLVLASKDIISNLFGSLSILMSRTYEIGEIIRVRGGVGAGSTIYEGVVEEITLNYTKLTNITGEVVFIPNRTIYVASIENISRRRFFTYMYHIPFKKWTESTEIETRLRIIEWKIGEYDPISIEYDTDIPNANDFVYKVTVKLPEENERFDSDMRHFLTRYIFIKE